MWPNLNHYSFVPMLNVSLLLQGAIIIHEVYEDGAAARDARLWAGDQVLEVSDLHIQTIHTLISAM